MVEYGIAVITRLLVDSLSHVAKVRMSLMRLTNTMILSCSFSCTPIFFQVIATMPLFCFMFTFFVCIWALGPNLRAVPRSSRHNNNHNIVQHSIPYRTTWPIQDRLRHQNQLRYQNKLRRQKEMSHQRLPQHQGPQTGSRFITGKGDITMRIAAPAVAQLPSR